MLTQETLHEDHSFEPLLNFSHLIPILISVHLGQRMCYCAKVNQCLGISIGHLSIHAMKFPGLCSDRLPFGPYDHHIRLDDIPPNEIHLVLGIPNFLDFFD